MMAVCDPKEADPINQYALVSYIEGRLGEFLNKLRQELVAGCKAYAHVTVLPPRPLMVDAAAAGMQLYDSLVDSAAFYAGIRSIQVFRATSVVYAEIGPGHSELIQLHGELNRGGLEFDEPYPYHPHITLAHGFDPDALEDLYEMASRRWREAALPREFPVDSLTFVQNTSSNLWLDLLQVDLKAVPQLR